ncbi:MAG: hypothetical protein H6Q80_468, partial [Deltaproteobacteria bacterium]|nr:hypothetical protein [Deltaproteobacteria bacterium]
MSSAASQLSIAALLLSFSVGVAML